MTQAMTVDQPTPEEENDPEFRRQFVEDVLEQASNRHLPVGFRCRRLLERYAEGAISYQHLTSEIVRPVLN